MTLGENKKMTLALIEEYSPSNNYLTDDIDIQTNLNLLYNMTYFRLAEEYGIIETAELDVEHSEEYTEIKLPKDLSKIKGLLTLNKMGEPQDNMNYFKVGKDKLRINNPNDYDFILEYYRYPTMIDEDTDDEFELELDIKAQMILPYGVASAILINDPSANYSAFEAKYQNELVNLDIDRSETQFSIG